MCLDGIQNRQNTRYQLSNPISVKHLCFFRDIQVCRMKNSLYLYLLYQKLIQQQLHGELKPLVKSHDRAELCLGGYTRQRSQAYCHVCSHFHHFVSTFRRLADCVNVMITASYSFKTPRSKMCFSGTMSVMHVRLSWQQHIHENASDPRSDRRHTCVQHCSSRLQRVCL